MFRHGHVNLGVYQRHRKSCISNVKNNIDLTVLIGEFLRGGIFTVKIPTFSGKTAEKVMEVYGFDCPAIFWDQECSTFWGVVEGVLEH